MAYVYGHYTADTGKLFYVGKGIKKRAWSFRSRNRYWYNVVNKHGIDIKILYDNLTEEEAYEKEKEIIAEVGLNNLTNVLSGGEGMTSDDVKSLYKNPEYREKMKAAHKRLQQDPKWIQTMKECGENGKLKMQDPSIKEKHLNSVRNVAQTEEWQIKQTEGIRKKTKTDEWKQKHKDGIQKRSQDPSWKEKQRQRSIKYWESKRAAKQSEELTNEEL